MRKISFTNKSGFTLVEFLLYLSLFAVFFLSLFAILHIFYNNQAKNNIRLEVEQQGLFISQVISQKIRNAQAIMNTGNQLSLEAFDSNRSPIVISLVDGQIIFQEANQPAVNLSSSRVEVINLSFSNTSSNNISAVYFSFTIRYKEFEKEFFKTANLNLINL